MLLAKAALIDWYLNEKFKQNAVSIMSTMLFSKIEKSDFNNTPLSTNKRSPKMHNAYILRIPMREERLICFLNYPKKFKKKFLTT